MRCVFLVFMISFERERKLISEFVECMKTINNTKKVNGIWDNRRQQSDNRYSNVLVHGCRHFALQTVILILGWPNDCIRFFIGNFWFRSEQHGLQDELFRCVVDNSEHEREHSKHMAVYSDHDHRHHRLSVLFSFKLCLVEFGSRSKKNKFTTRQINRFIVNHLQIS